MGIARKVAVAAEALDIRGRGGLDPGPFHVQIEGEGRSAARIVLGPDATAHAVDDLAADGQSETRAVLTRAVHEGLEDRVDTIGVDAGAVVADTGLQPDAIPVGDGLQPGLDDAVSGETQRVADQVVEQLGDPRAIDDGGEFGVALIADHQGHIVLRRPRSPCRLDIVHQGAQGRCCRMELQLAGFGARQVKRVLENAQQGLGRLHDRGDVSVRLGVQRLAAKQFGHRQHAIHRRAQLVTHDGQELALVAGRGEGLCPGVGQDAGLFRQFEILLPLQFVDRLQQGAGRTDAVIATLAGDDEAPHQCGRAAFQQDITEGVDSDAGLHHRRFRVHDVQDRAIGVLGMAKGAGDFQQEGMAFDQTHGPSILDDRDHQGVGFTLEAREDVDSRRLGRHRLGALGQDFYGRHGRPLLHWDRWTLDQNRLRKG